MPYKDNQIKACFAQANNQTGAKKKKRISGCKKMVKYKHGHHSEGYFNNKLEAILDTINHPA